MIFRVLFVFSLLLWSLLLKQSLWMFCLLTICMLLMWVHGAKGVTYTRSFKLLLWLFIPIIVFQGFFTPGSYIQKPFYIPLSSEGLLHAWSLCIHITLIFFVALLFFRLITLKEWYRCLNASYTVSLYTKPYILLIKVLRVKVAEILTIQQLTWKNLDNKLLRLPDLVVETILLVLEAAKKEAGNLWLDWDTKVLESSELQKSKFELKKTDLIYALFIPVGWSLFWMT